MNFYKNCNAIFTVLFLNLIFLFVSCGGNDDETEKLDNTPGSTPVSVVPENIKPYVGYWKIGGGNFSSLMFYQDNIVRINKEFKTYDWNYSPSTSILTTNYNDGRYVMQWNITQKTDDTWTGIGIDSNDGRIYSARRDFEDGYFDSDGRYLVRFNYPEDTLIWSSKEDQKLIEKYKENHPEELLVGCISWGVNRYDNNYDYSYYDNKGNAISLDDLKNGTKILDLDIIKREDNIRIFLSYHNAEKIKKLPYSVKRSKDGEYMEFKNTLEIHHPLSYKQVYYVYNEKYGYYRDKEYVGNKWGYNRDFIYHYLIDVDSIVGTFVPVNN